MNRSQPSPVTFDKKDVEIIARETLYRGFFFHSIYTGFAIACSMAK